MAARPGGQQAAGGAGDGAKQDNGAEEARRRE
jgi:hypothetical protein